MTYLDASVIVKRYYAEAGTERVHERWAVAERLFTSRVAYAEVHAALARKRRERDLSASRYRRSVATFETEWPAYDHVDVDATTLSDVQRLVSTYPLRGYDVVHLSAALWVQRQIGTALEFWVSDDQLETAARAERFAVVNPAS
jgi:predicted nucleic acid-binding protein